MVQSDESVLLDLLKRLQLEALHQESSITVLQKSLQIALEISGWDYAAVSKLSNDNQSVELLAFISPQKIYKNSSYDLLGTPCQLVLSQDEPVCYLDMQQRFSDEIGIKDLGVQSYLGMMYYLAGKPLGHVYFMSKQVMSDRDIEQSNLIIQLLSVFIGSRVELIDSYRELDEQRRKATVDSLTGAYNRRRFDQDMKRVKKQYQRGLLSDALLVMFDIDDLKTVNDVYGHPDGDEVIRLTYSLFIENFRKADLIYRLGGDEFAILILGNTQSMLGKIPSYIEIIRQRLRTCRYPNIGVSVGSGLLSEAQFEIDSWIKQVDEHLYMDKQGKFQRINNKM